MPKQQKSCVCSSLHTQTPFPPTLYLPACSSSHLSGHSPAAESYSMKSMSLPSPVPYSCWFKHVWGTVDQARVCQARLPCVVVQVVRCIKTLEWRLKTQPALSTLSSAVWHDLLLWKLEEGAFFLPSCVSPRLYLFSVLHKGSVEPSSSSTSGQSSLITKQTLQDSSKRSSGSVPDFIKF